MNWAIVFCRRYCKTVPELVNNLTRPKIDYTKLIHNSKVPTGPVKSNIRDQKDVHISLDLIQSLERLSLVNLDGEEALRILRSSIYFAENVRDIDTDNVKPLYTVLHNQSLRLRTDQVDDGNCRELILQNSRVTDEDYFISPPGNIPLQQ